MSNAKELVPVPAKPLPTTSVEVSPMGDEDVKQRAHLLVSMKDLALCNNDLADFIIQGVSESNAAKRGGVSAGLRRAAYRIEKGNLEGFKEEETRRLLPFPDTKSLFAFISKTQESIGEAVRETDVALKNNKLGALFTELNKFLAKNDPAKKKITTMSAE